MKSQVKVIIGIQARTTSTRLPGKVMLNIGGFKVLDRVIHACSKSVTYMNKFSSKSGIHASMNLLVPFGDELCGHYGSLCLEGPEQDVLHRYYLLASEVCPDYIVRITSDCPMLPSYLITKSVKCAVINSYDYLSNVDPIFRTFPDGMDVEVLSNRAVKWLHDNAISMKDREHVTTLMRSAPPDWAKCGAIIGTLDLSDMKISLDTKEDLVVIKHEIKKVEDKKQRAIEAFGSRNVHSF